MTRPWTDPCDIVLLPTNPPNKRCSTHEVTWVDDGPCPGRVREVQPWPKVIRTLTLTESDGPIFHTFEGETILLATSPHQGRIDVWLESPSTADTSRLVEYHLVSGIQIPPMGHSWVLSFQPPYQYFVPFHIYRKDQR